MSIFAPATLDCPRCAAPVHFQAVHSVNGGRRPDQRAAILDGSLQRETCAACGATFRLDPLFAYVDVGRGQWIAARPVPEIEHWPEREAEARALFGRAYGADAPAPARRLGAGLVPRIVFGWPALREKLIAAEAGIDDATLELLKLVVMRSLSELPFSADSSPRLMDYTGDELLIGWVRNADGAVGERRWVSRDIAVGIAAGVSDGVADDAEHAERGTRDEASEWADTRAELDGALFVDIDRWLVTPAAT